MDDAGTGIHGDVVGKHTKNDTIQERVSELCVLQFSAGKAGEYTRLLQTDLPSKVVG